MKRPNKFVDKKLRKGNNKIDKYIERFKILQRPKISE